LGIADRDNVGMKTLLIGASTALLAVCGKTAADDIFRGLGFPPGQTEWSSAHGISANGNWVIGNWLGYGVGLVQQPFAWSADTFVLRTYEFGGGMAAISSSGLAVGTGYMRFATQAIGWNVPTNQSFLATPSHWMNSTGHAISADGSTFAIGGEGYWLIRDGIWQSVSAVGSGPVLDHAGNRVCGTINPLQPGSQGFIWSEATGAVPVGLLPGWSSSAFFAISNDGLVSVGYGVNPEGRHQPIMWREPWGLRAIAILAGSAGSEAWGVSGDGRVIVGRAIDPNLAFVWDRVRGTRNLKSYLMVLGSTDVLGWTLNYAGGISADGRTIVGTGIDPQGRTQAWLARIPAFCYANCDISVTPPVLNVADFACFLQRYANGDPYANCDESTTMPVLNVADFACFLQHFAAGCPG
jgi:hypothetical protein